MEIFKEIIDKKEDDVIATKGMEDKDLIELVNYMLQKESVVTRLNLTEGSLTKNGIDYLVQNYPSLLSLDLSYNNLINEDIKNIHLLPKLKELSVEGNLLTEEGVKLLREKNLEFLNVQDNDLPNISESQNKEVSSSE